MASNVSIVSINTALRDQPFTQTDSQCDITFNQIEASAFRILSASVPLSQYTMTSLTNKLAWGNEVNANFLTGDYLDFTTQFWSSLGTDQGPFAFYETNEATGVQTYFRSAVVQTAFYNDIGAVLSQINPPAGSTAISRLVYNAFTRRIELFMDPAPEGVTIRANFDTYSEQMLGLPGGLVSRRTGSNPTVPAIIASFPVNLTPKPGTMTYQSRWTPIPNSVYTSSQIVNELNAAQAVSIPTLPTSSFPYPWFTVLSGRVALSDSNFKITFTASNPRILAVTGITDGTWSPTLFKNPSDSPSRTQISPQQIAVSVTTPVYIDHVLTFDIDRLYTEASLLTALNAEFSSYGLVWTAANNRFIATNAEQYVIRLSHNDVLGLRTPDFIYVPKASIYKSPYTYDLSGLTDTMSLGFPSLFHTGRTSQGSANAKHTRRRDICLTLTNTSAIAYGSMLTYQAADPTFISLGRTQNISTLRLCLYDAIFNPIETTWGQSIHVTIEFI